MPKAKKTINKTSSFRRKSPARSLSRAKNIVKNQTDLNPTPAAVSPMPKMSNKVFLLLALIVVLVLVLYKNKGVLVAAMVNGKPVLRYSLDAKLEQRYGAATLDEIINEQLIRDEAGQKGFKASSSEIDTKVGEITKRFGDQKALDSVLAQQGMTMAELKKQVELQVLIEKITAGSVNVSDQDVASYIEKNRSSLTATDEAGLRDEALGILTQQKKGEAFQKWFADLKAKAKVTKYL